MSHKTNSWEEEDVKRGKKQQKEGHLGHARALFDDAHGSYNYNGHNSTGAEHHDGHPFKNITMHFTGAKESAAKNKGVLYNKGMMNHPAKMNDYGDPAGKEVTIASQKKLLASDASPEFKAAIAKEKPIKMSEDLSNPVLSDDMNLTGQGYAQDEGGNTSIMPALRNLYGMRK
tara:strand:- start:245 stop:763 length:519 start_codon:yes stop_codon:yes gene_type:complete